MYPFEETYNARFHRVLPHLHQRADVFFAMDIRVYIFLLAGWMKEGSFDVYKSTSIYDNIVLKLEKNNLPSIVRPSSSHRPGTHRPTTVRRSSGHRPAIVRPLACALVTLLLRV